MMPQLSAEASVPLENLRSGQMRDDDWTRVANIMARVSEAPLDIDDSANLSMTEIRAKARRLKQRQGLRLIIIDYLQLMSSRRRVESRACGGVGVLPSDQADRQRARGAGGGPEFRLTMQYRFQNRATSTGALSRSPPMTACIDRTVPCASTGRASEPS